MDICLSLPKRSHKQPLIIFLFFFSYNAKNGEYIFNCTWCTCFNYFRLLFDFNILFLCQKAENDKGRSVSFSLACEGDFMCADVFFIVIFMLEKCLENDTNFTTRNFNCNTYAIYTHTMATYFMYNIFYIFIRVPLFWYKISFQHLSPWKLHCIFFSHTSKIARTWNEQGKTLKFSYAYKKNSVRKSQWFMRETLTKTHKWREEFFFFNLKPNIPSLLCVWFVYSVRYFMVNHGCTDT